MADALDRYCARPRGKRRGEHDEGRAGDTGRSLRGQQQNHQQAICCSNGSGVSVACAENTAAVAR